MQENHVLYRKYRPQVFKDVWGQDLIVANLTQAIKKVPAHAYLFTGARGTGKTTIARIFARELGTDTVDLYEIDAASHNSVEDIRELRDAVLTLPVLSRYKVYILDEVHMLSKAAFNALLKTLEEPPKHVIFVLATTEFHKVPDTIISRCQVFHFDSPTESLLRDFIVDIAKKEGYILDSAGAELIALLGDRSFRDTHGVLQKVLESVGDKKTITTEMVESITGTPSQSLVEIYIEAFISGEIHEILEKIEVSMLKSLSVEILFRRIISTYRQILLARVDSKYLDTNKILSMHESTFIKNLIQQYSKEINSQRLLILLQMYEKYPSFPDKILGLILPLVDSRENLAANKKI